MVIKWYLKNTEEFSLLLGPSFVKKKGILFYSIPLHFIQNQNNLSIFVVLTKV